MVASKHGFPLVRWAVVVCSYDDRGTWDIFSRCHAGAIAVQRGAVADGLGAWSVMPAPLIRAGFARRTVNCGTGSFPAHWCLDLEGGKPWHGGIQRTIRARMAAGGFQRGRTTPAVRLTRPRMAWTPRPKRYGTPPRIRPLAPRRTMSKKRRCSTGPVWRRKSDGKETTRPDRRNANRGASGRAWPVGALAIGHQPLPCLPHSCWGLVRVLSHLMGRPGR